MSQERALGMTLEELAELMAAVLSWNDENHPHTKEDDGDESFRIALSSGSTQLWEDSSFSEIFKIND